MVKVLLMRHAESKFNEEWRPLMRYFNFSGEGKALPDHEKSRLSLEIRASSRPELINAALNDIGRKQCHAAQAKLNSYKDIKHVFVSPMLRTLQTFEESMETHPNIKANKIKVDLLPDLRERCHSNCDLSYLEQDPFDNQQMLEVVRWPELYDWSWVKAYEDPKFWWLENGDATYAKEKLA